MEPVGYTWLVERFALTKSPITHQSYLGIRSQLNISASIDRTIEIFQKNYDPGDDPLAHVAFALKYDDLNLDLLSQLFRILPAQQVADYIAHQPSGKFARQIGFLCEFLSGKLLPVGQPSGGNYVDLLDAARYVTAAPRKNRRWRIHDNLLGTADYCPVIRRTAAFSAVSQQDFSGRITDLLEQVPPDIFRRAVDYLYFKETKSSYDIEREQPGAQREERFVALLRNAGQASSDVVLAQANLVALQNLIVEARYAQEGFRTWQNYIGESPPNRSPIVHYVCPPGDMVAQLMAGLSAAADKMAGVDPLVRAAVLAFGFVFIHPFEDGNGRIHRYLIHDSLARDGVVPPGMILPVSATMLHNMRAYDAALEAYSKPLKVIIQYDLDQAGALRIRNPEQVRAYYRYPDLTAQTIYTLEAVAHTINTELMSEIAFVGHYDQARSAIKNIVDMPDRKLDRLIQFLHQNQGILSKTKRHFFDELHDAEIAGIEAAYRQAFSGVRGETVPTES